ncbi:unnamed protein product [Pocillopora meandrina]|uniref:Uncharacterized protein n=1 Tax=Pocillopora meandrina TaxID=46732 RepID=A0AAU9VN50_9CNID|nr:unnamed protein product [Pocillopora meandrina]
MKEIPYLPVSEMDFTSAKKKYELMVEKQVTPMATRSNSGIQITRTPAPTPEEQKTFFTSIPGCTVKPAVLSLVTPLTEQCTCRITASNLKLLAKQTQLSLVRVLLSPYATLKPMSFQL